MRPDWISGLAMTLALLLLVMLPAPAQSQSNPAPEPQQRLEDVQRDMEAARQARQELNARAAALQAEWNTVRALLVSSAERIQDLEETLTRIEDRATALHREQRQLRAALERRQVQGVRVLTAVQRLAWRPTNTLLIHPSDPANTVRGAILLRSAIPRIRESAHNLVGRLQELHRVDVALKAERALIGTTRDRLRTEHDQIAQLLNQTRSLRQLLRREQSEADRRLADLGREAGSLRELMLELERAREQDAIARAAREKAAQEQAAREMAEREQAARDQAERDRAERARRAAEQQQARRTEPSSAPTTPVPGSQNGDGTATVSPPSSATVAALATPPPQPSGAEFRAAKGRMPLPARGKLIAQFGDTSETEETIQGIRLQTRPGAQVIAPYNGTIKFSGPFRGYGNILILEHGDGYHTLLAGLERLDGQAGHYVAAGEPVGRMGSEEEPVLYVELRLKGQPIDPLPWLSANKGGQKG